MLSCGSVNVGYLHKIKPVAVRSLSKYQHAFQEIYVQAKFISFERSFDLTLIQILFLKYF